MREASLLYVYQKPTTQIHQDIEKSSKGSLHVQLCIYRPFNKFTVTSVMIQWRKASTILKDLRFIYCLRHEECPCMNHTYEITASIVDSYAFFCLEKLQNGEYHRHKAQSFWHIIIRYVPRVFPRSYVLNIYSSNGRLTCMENKCPSIQR